MAKEPPISGANRCLPNGTCKGKPAAVPGSSAEHERRAATLDVLSDPDLMDQIRRSERFYATGRHGLSFEDVFGEPVRPLRTRRR